MLETLSKTQQTIEPPFKFNVPHPAGVTDLNRPMLINTTTTNKWKEVGGAGTYKKQRSSYQPRKQSGVYQTELRQQRLENAKNNGELAALSKLMDQTTNGSTGGGIGGKGVRSGGRVRRSKSEPTYLPPIEEGAPPPGGKKNHIPHAKGYKSPSYEVIKRGRKTQPDGLNKHVSNNPDSTVAHILPTLSKVTEQKTKYKDGAFIKGVQRHTGKHNVNMALGRPPPRIPRYSWEDTSKPKPVKDSHARVEVNKAEVNQLPLRLRDMDLTFPLKNKMENIRQWHENQFNTHLEQWKNAGSESDKKEEALKLLARYLEKESTAARDQIETTLEEDGMFLGGKSNRKSPRPATEKGMQGRRGRSRCSAYHQNHPNQHINQEITSDLPLEDQAVEYQLPNSQSPDNGGGGGDDDLSEDDVFLPKPIRTITGRLIEDQVVYTDAERYIQENHLLPPDKSRRIHDWLDSIDLTEDPDAAPVYPPPVSPNNTERSPVTDSENDWLSEFSFHPG